MTETMNALARCRKALHQVLSEQFESVIETGLRVRVLDLPIGAVDFPAIVVAPGDPWLSGQDERLSLCGTHIVSFDLLVMGGNPLLPDSWETVEQWVTEIEPLLAEGIYQSEYWDPRDGALDIDSVRQPHNAEYGGKETLTTVISVSAPIHL